jgi:hypothetical protein
MIKVSIFQEKTLHSVRLLRIIPCFSGVSGFFSYYPEKYDFAHGLIWGHNIILN